MLHTLPKLVSLLEGIVMHRKREYLRSRSRMRALCKPWMLLYGNVATTRTGGIKGVAYMHAIFLNVLNTTACKLYRD